MTIRKTQEVRRAEIRDAALSVFVEYGIQKATMDEIIRRTSLSKGGVYHHYSNIDEILFDIFMKANEQRIDIMRTWMQENNLSIEQITSPRYMARAITDKVLTINPYAKLYAEFLILSRTNPRFGKLYNSLIDTCKGELESFFCGFPSQNLWSNNAYEGLTELINMFIVSINLLGSHSYFVHHRDEIESIFYAHLSHTLTGDKDAL